MCDADTHSGLVVDPNLSPRMVTAGATRSAVVRHVDVTMADGVADSVLAYPEGEGAWPAVLIWTDIFGVRPVYEEMAARLAAEGYVVLVPNPFYRLKRAPVLEGTVNFDDPVDRETKLGPLIRSLRPESGGADAVALFAYLDGLPQVDTSRKAGVQGYCLGGGFAFRTAAALAGRIGAAASYHGRLYADAPDSAHLLIPRIKAETIAGIARNDDAGNPEEKTVIKQAFDAAGVPVTVEVYDADHGWCVKGSPVYDEAAAEKAWAGLLDLYRRRLA